MNVKTHRKLLTTYLALLALAVLTGFISTPSMAAGAVTVVDDIGDEVTLESPAKTFVYHGHNSYVYESLRALGVSDRIVGVSDRFVTEGASRYSKSYFPELVDFTNVGILKSPNYETINSLRPDVVVSDEESYYDRTKTPRIPVAAIDAKPINYKTNILKFGTLFGVEKKAEEYLQWCLNLENTITNRVASVAAKDKPLVYIGYYAPDSRAFQLPAKDNYRNMMIRLAGGRGMGDEIEGSAMPDVDAEWIITRNPDVMIFSTSTQYVGYDITDPKAAQALIDDFTSRPEFAGINAVKNKRIYVVSHAYLLCGGASGLIGSSYYAKWMYPELFADFDVLKVHQEFVTRFQGLDLKVKDVICTYPSEK